MLVDPSDLPPSLVEVLELVEQAGEPVAPWLSRLPMSGQARRTRKWEGLARAGLLRRHYLRRHQDWKTAYTLTIEGYDALCRLRNRDRPKGGFRQPAEMAVVVEDRV